MESVPELRDDGELLALHKTLVDGALDALSGPFLITIIWRSTAISRDRAGIPGQRTECAIEHPVSGLDRVVDNICRVLGHFPETESMLSDQHLIEP